MTAAAQPEALPKEPPKVPVQRDTERDYVILRFDGHSYKRVGTQSARSQDDALDEHVASLPDGEQEGVFVTVPARYWKMRKSKVKVVTERNVSYDDLSEKQATQMLSDGSRT